MDLNNLNWYIEFLEVKPTGPEAGMNGEVKVYSCFADLYEPTQKDVQLFSVVLYSAREKTQLFDPASEPPGPFSSAETSLMSLHLQDGLCSCQGGRPTAVQ